jgi:hypothetical protein
VMATASPADLQKRSAELGYDYLLLAEEELRNPKPGALGGLMKPRTVGGGRAPPRHRRENTESVIAIKLLARRRRVSRRRPRARTAAGSACKPASASRSSRAPCT